MIVRFSALALHRALRSREGGVAIEYALLGAIVGLGVLSGLRGVRNNLTTNYDLITLALQRVATDTSGTRKEISRDNPFTYTSNGQTINQIWVRYDDGSSALIRTSPDPNSWFKQIYYDFGKDGLNHGATVTRSNNSVYQENYEYVRDGVIAVSYSENGSAHTYLQQQIDLGGGYYGYRQTMTSTNIQSDWSSGYVVNYYGPDSKGNYVENSVGARYTYPNGQVVNSGSDITPYIR